MPNQLYIAILDNGPPTSLFAVDNGAQNRQIAYYTHLDRAVKWVVDTLSEGGYRLIEHPSHIEGYVTTQGGYHSPAVVDRESPIGGATPPFVTITPIYHTTP